MTSGRLRLALILALLLVATLAGLAAAQSATRPSSGDAVADRQRLMKLNGASWADIQAKVKAGNIEAVAVNAETIAVMAPHIPALFPAAPLSDRSNAKPEIWQRWSEFEGSAKTLQALAERLRDAARAKDAPAIESLVKDFGQQGCGACHTPFRQPPKQ